MSDHQCPLCGKFYQYTHRDGLPVRKCPDYKCPNGDRWLPYLDEDYDEDDKRGLS